MILKSFNKNSLEKVVNKAYSASLRGLYMPLSEKWIAELRRLRLTLLSINASNRKRAVYYCRKKSEDQANKGKYLPIPEITGGWLKNEGIANFNLNIKNRSRAAKVMAGKGEYIEVPQKKAFGFDRLRRRGLSKENFVNKKTAFLIKNKST